MEINILEGNRFKVALRGGGDFLLSNKEEVNSLNIFPVPDGDTGTNMGLTVKSAVKEALDTEGNHCGDIAKNLSQGSLMGARGNSGVILSQIFRGFSQGFGDKEKIDIESLAKAFKSASDTAYKAVMKPTEGTILTVIRACGEFAIENYKKYTDILEFYKDIIDAGNKALARTPELLPVLKEAGVIDAGGQGLMYILEGGYNSLIGREEFVADNVSSDEKFEEVVNHEHLDISSLSDIKYSYCTEFMIEGDDSRIDELRNTLSLEGDSLMVVGSDGLIKVHIHTNIPGNALEAGLKIGRLKDIKIDNMLIQYESILKDKNEKVEADQEYSIVAISIGEGIDKLFKDLNVDQIVSGGQTMNPSTEDILSAIGKTRGKNVFVLPNNKNILLAAEQTIELSDRNVIVIPSKSIPEGIGALLQFSPDLDLDLNYKNMLDGMSGVKSGEVTYAVRDSEINGIKIEAQDFIGIYNGEIIEGKKKIDQVSLGLIDSMVDEDTEIVTLLYGEGVNEEEANELVDRIEVKYPDIDVELIYGGQPLYYYLISVE